MWGVTLAGLVGAVLVGALRSRDDSAELELEAGARMKRSQWSRERKRQAELRFERRVERALAAGLPFVPAPRRKRGQDRSEQRTDESVIQARYGSCCDAPSDAPEGPVYRRWRPPVQATFRDAGAEVWQEALDAAARGEYGKPYQRRAVLGRMHERKAEQWAECRRACVAPYWREEVGDGLRIAADWQPGGGLLVARTRRGWVVRDEDTRAELEGPFGERYAAERAALELWDARARGRELELGEVPF